MIGEERRMMREPEGLDESVSFKSVCVDTSAHQTSFVSSLQPGTELS